MAEWLLKTEPSDYSFADLEKAGKAVVGRSEEPRGPRNLRAMKDGDRVIVYHTGDEKAAVGLAEVVREAYPDPKRGTRSSSSWSSGGEALPPARDPGGDQGAPVPSRRARSCDRAACRWSP